MHSSPASALDPTAARERLIELNTRLAARLARRYRAEAQPEALSAALRGLAVAAESFDPASSEDFTAFAVPIIIRQLRTELRLGARAVAPGAGPDLRAQIIDTLAEVGDMTAQSLAVRLETPLEEIVDALGLIDAAAVAAALTTPRASRTQARLDAAEQLIFDLRYGCGLSVPDIAATLGIGSARVRTLLRIAVGELCGASPVTAA